MGSKRESLLGRISGGLAESVGIREGESPMPHYQRSGAAPKTTFVRSRDTGEIELSEIIPDPDQPRKEFDESELENLASSIKNHGLLQAIRVRWSDEHGKWVITAGERRYRAHKIAGLDRIKCTFDDSGADTNTVRSQQIIENVLREELTGIELGYALKHLMESNEWSAKQVGQELNISKGKVSKALALLKLPDDVQEKVRSGEISPATAYEITKVKDKAKQAQLAQKASAGHVKSSDAAAQVDTKKRTRKTTNETFRTGDSVRVAISSRRDIGEQGMINALLEVADEIRKRTKKAA